jgi:hypothetical protein
LNAQNAIGLTPTGPALDGALSAAKTWAGASPGRRAAVVLVSDGVPTASGCTPNTTPEIQTLVSGYASGSPAVKTYVVGIANDSGTAAFWSAVASSGGTSAARFTSSAAMITQAFDQIRAEFVTCN